MTIILSSVPSISRSLLFRRMHLNIGSVSDAKEQRYLDRFEALLLRVYNGVNSRVGGDGNLPSGVSRSFTGSYAGYAPPSAQARPVAGNSSKASSQTVRAPLLGEDDYIDAPGASPGRQPMPRLPSTQSSVNGRSRSISGDLGSTVRGSLGSIHLQPSVLPDSDDHELFMVVDNMSSEDRARYIDAICTAIRHHVHFPAACSSEPTVDGKITFPRSYLLGIIPSCVERYDFSDRNFAFKIPRIAADAIAILHNSYNADEVFEVQATQDATDRATAHAATNEQGGDPAADAGAGAGAVASLPPSSFVRFASVPSSDAAR